jgi:ATP-dependent DNA helicase PIF1
MWQAVPLCYGYMRMAPVNHGMPWSPEQDAWLWTAARKHKVTIGECAARMERSSGSIRSRLVSIACRKIVGGELTLEEACALTHTPKDFLLAKLEALAPHEPSKDGPINPQNSITEGPTSDPAQMEALTQEQECVVRAIFEDKRSVFLTGPAGTGKSVTVRAVVREAHARGCKVGVTATTGAAAYLIQGHTLHSFLGIGLGKMDALALAHRIRRNRNGKEELLRALDLLIIDEVSMLDDTLFQKISRVLQILRGSQAPFGGLQLLLCGDMCQLQSVQGTYCFLSKEWDRLDPKMVTLTTIFRQGDDLEFSEMLLRLRWGRCEDDDLARLKRCKDTVFPEGILPTRLFALNKDAQRVNDEEYHKLVGAGATVKRYTANFRGHGHVWPTEKVKAWADGGGIPKTLDLCMGAQVVVTHNLKNNAWVVNGTRGTVEQLHTDAVVIRTREGLVKIPMTAIPMEDEPRAHVTCMPLRLAWAISIHKSQGMTLDCLEVDLGESIFAYGQAYTALSRARNLQSVRVTKLRRSAFKTHPAVQAFYGVL